MPVHKPRIFPLIQLLYYFITAVWPLVHMKSFLDITGDKTDLWLVKTVSVLLLPYCILLLLLSLNSKKNLIIVAAVFLGGLSLAVIDVYYYFSNVIKWVYLIDAFIQTIFLIYWLFYIINSLKKNNQFSR